MKLDYPGQFDEDIKQEADGSFTVSLSPWWDEPVTGIPSRDLALRFCYAAHQAMRSYADNALIED